MLPKLTETQRDRLLAETARLVRAAATGKSPDPTKSMLTSELAALPLAGVFVTLRKHGDLRGCCGRLGEAKPLSELLGFAAQQTTLHDPRFKPVAPSELPDLTMDCSLLGPRTAIPGPAAQRDQHVEVGRHGLRISTGLAAGLLLPQVPVELGWNKLQFLAGVCRKAGLPPDAWRSDETTLEVFEGLHFGGPFPKASESSSNSVPPSRVTRMRPSAVAGQFYPAHSESRNALIDDLLSTRKHVALGSTSSHETSELTSASAIMTPHAGLRYSGRVAASTWGNVRIPDRILIIGPKHTRDGVRFAVAPHEVWELSDDTHIDADLELMSSIANNVPGMMLDPDAHAREHAIEVELPFIARLRPDAKVCGIVMGAATWPELDGMSEALAQVIQRMPAPPLIAISSDMNHFANDDENRRLDAIALETFASRDGEQLLQVCHQHRISMCGVVPAALVLQTLKILDPQFAVHVVDYATSAEVSGDKSRVVGYAGAIITTST